MSRAAVDAASGLRQALCLDCGAVRSAKAHYLGRGSRILRCVPCGGVTTHAAVNWDGTDDREDANAEQNQRDALVSQELAQLLGLFQACGIDVLMDAREGTHPEAQPQGGLVDVVRWLQPEGYLVRVQHDLSVADRLYCLDWAWKSLRPAIARWARCVVEVDLDGQPFQRIYNNELETGAFVTS